MDRFVNKKIEKQTIYEIYRACRLCGAGGGYKMPIIQNVVNLDNCDVELRQKIRECVQIEVHQGDKMPPLICELCVDKVNDFYEFLEMCRQTNKRTRLKLGLPPQMLPRGAPDAGDCILGVTEPVFAHDDDSSEPPAPPAHRRGKTRARVKSEPVRWKAVKVKTEKPPRPPTPPAPPARPSRRRAPSPPRLRGSRRSDPDNMALSKLQTRIKKSASPPPKSILKKANKPPSARPKRSRDDEQPSTPPKRVKISLKPVAPKPRPSRRREDSPRRATGGARCPVCGARFKTPQALLSHRRSHANHAVQTNKRPESPAGAEGLRCESCWDSFPTRSLLNRHRCAGESGRKGKCADCCKTFASRKSLANHRRYCKKGEVSVPAELRRRLRELRVRVARCDPLLAHGRCRVDHVPPDYGLDPGCVYPFSPLALRIKPEPTDCMVTINDLDFGSYIHWDSDDEDGSDSDRDGVIARPPGPSRVQSLAAWALKTIFSNKLLGKVPRKHRRLKIETVIDSSLNDSLSDLNLNCDTVNCSDDVAASDNVEVKVDEGEDDLFPKVNNSESVTNDDFDRLFNSSSKCDGVSDDSGNVTVSDSKLESLKDDNISEDDIDNATNPVDLNNGAKDSLNNLNSDSVNGLTNDKSGGSTERSDNGEEDSVRKNSVDSGNVETENRLIVNNDETKILERDLNGDAKKVADEDEAEANKTRINEANIEVNENRRTKNGVMDNDGDSQEGRSEMRDNIENRVSESVREDLNKVASDGSKNEKDSKGNTDDEAGDGSSRVNGADVDDTALNMNDLEDYSGAEFDDTELMAEIDAQIGEKKRDTAEKEMERSQRLGVKEDSTETRRSVEEKRTDVNIEEEAFEGKVTEDLGRMENRTSENLSSADDGRSMDLDSISEGELDFNE